MKYLFTVFFALIFAGCKFTPSSNGNQDEQSIERDTLSEKQTSQDSIAFNEINYISQADTLPPLYKSIINNIIRLAQIQMDIVKYPLEDKYNLEYKQLQLETIALLDSFSTQDLRYKSMYLFNVYYYAEYYEIEPVKRSARKYLNPGDLLANNHSKTIIDKKEWNDFKGYLRVTESGAVLSSCFEQVSNSQTSNSQNFRFPLETFYNYNNTKQYFLSDDTIIAAMPNGGFESIKNVLTVWQKRGDKYYLLSILDKWLNVNIGRIWVDTVINLDAETNILIGSSNGGDQGDNWGSLWIGLWEKPTKFKIIYSLNWCSSGSDSIRKAVNYATTIDKEKLIIEIAETTKKYNQDNLSEHLIDSVRKVKIVDLKSIMGRDITRAFNFGEQK